MAESKLRELSMDFSVDIINLVKHLKLNHEHIYGYNNFHQNTFLFSILFQSVTSIS